MTRESDFDACEVDACEVGGIDAHEVGGIGGFHEAGEDDRLRALLARESPEFPVTVALGDRVLAGAARRRARMRGFGGLGAVALVAGGALVVSPLAGWGGRVATSVGAPTPSLSAPPPSESPYASPPVSVTEAKVEAATRVMNALKPDHENSYMGVLIPNGQPDASPIVVYRKPVADPTLARDAAAAAAPYTVVFRDSVLDASEQWFLGQRMQQDMNYWKGRGVQFATALQEDGTITVYTPDPAEVVPLLEQHYGYDGRVFVGQVWRFAPSGVTSTGR